jgi:N-acetylmuramoyl-L-alanine amidase
VGIGEAAARMTLTHPSPNHNSRGANEVRVIVLHADASPNERGCLSWIQSSESKVSYHVLIGRDGSVFTCVSYDRRAWHAGKAEWNGAKDVNGISIGVAFSNRNDGIEALTNKQIEAAKKVIADIRTRYGTHLPVTTHAAIAPGRKSDPEKCPGFRLSDYA